MRGGAGIDHGHLAGRAERLEGLTRRGSPVDGRRNQRSSSAGSLTARQTRSTECGGTRSKRSTGRPSIVSRVPSVMGSPPGVVQGRPGARPECAVAGKPRVDLSEGFGAKLVETPSAIRANRDQPGLAQHLEVLGDARLAEFQALHKLSDGPLAIAQQIEDLPPVRLGEGSVGLAQAARAGVGLHELAAHRVDEDQLADVGQLASRGSRTSTATTACAAATRRSGPAQSASRKSLTTTTIPFARASRRRAAARSTARQRKTVRRGDRPARRPRGRARVAGPALRDRHAAAAGG